MVSVSIFQVLSLVSVALYLVGLLNNLLSAPPNGCIMTYMYEYPQFVKIKVADNEKYPQYGMYAYSEGKFTERARKMKFDGIPVLFLPGNIGSYKQVRSLASVALRKSLPISKYGFHFDYFTVDFNDEMSGLFGGVLEKQTSFATLCVDSILKLYETNGARQRKPTSVIIIGHSMGGIIGKALWTRIQNRNKINLLITLASPHEAPVITIDHLMRNFYENISNYWDLKNADMKNLPAITDYWKNNVAISIGGGVRDFLMPSSLIASPHADVQALTTAIPGVWVSTDHLCILWCKQLVIVLNRLLFSIVDPSTKQLSSNSTYITNMAKHYLKIGYSRNYTVYGMPVEFTPDANWYEDSMRQYTKRHDRVDKTWYYMVRLIDLPENEAVTIEVVDLDDNEWLFGCQAKYVYGQHRVCKNGRHLSHFARWTPSTVGKRKLAIIDLRALRISYPHWTHVLIRILPTIRPVELHVDIHSKGSRRIEAALPAPYNLNRRILIKQTQPNSLQYNISLSGLDMLYQAYLLYVEPIDSCQNKVYHSTAELTIPWADGYENYHYFTINQKSPMRIKLLKGSLNYSKENAQDVNIALTLDPQCRYTVSIAVSPYDMLGQFMRHYTTSLPSYLAAVLLLVLRQWAAHMSAKQDNVSFHSALCGECVKPYYLLMSARLSSVLFVLIPGAAKITAMLTIGMSASQNFLILPLLLYMIALGTAHVLGAIGWGFIVFSGQIAHRIILRLLSFGRAGGGGRIWEWITKEMQNVPAFCGFLLVAFGMNSCGAISLIMGVFFYFIMITKLYEEYLEDIVYRAIIKVAKTIGDKLRRKSKVDEPADKTEVAETSDVAETNETPTASEQPVTNRRRNKSRRRSSESLISSLHFHFAMFFIWCFVTLLNIPTLITWAHNAKYNRVLESDPSFYPSMILSVCAFSLWQIDAPKKNIKFYEVIEKLIYFTAVAAIMIAPMSLYRLNYLLCGAFSLITLHQVFSFKDGSETDEADNVDSQEATPDESNLTEQSKDKIEEIKTKLDAI